MVHQPHQITLSFLCAAFHHSSCAPVAVKKKGFQSRWMGSHCPLITVGHLPTSTVSPQSGDGEARGGEEGAGQSPWALRSSLCLVPLQGHRMLGKSGLESSKGRQAAQGQGGRKKRCTGLDSLWPLRSPPVWSPTPHRWGDRLPGKPKGPRDTTPAIAGSSQPALPKGCSSLQAPLHSIPNTSRI